ncbi:MAG TPA: phosphoribosylamine--glycine ligase, partial [Dehalococcoidia bacterium]|nr:phosphoribosylamine--glycine ligase [Dehalococcoidia bacterium]
KIPIIGPSKAAARVESSKIFSKMLMQKYGIPCGKSESFSDYHLANKYVVSQKMPLVIKADGLAAGKGVVIALSQEEAQAALSDMMITKKFGMAGERIIVEEYLEGQEISVLAFTDGKTVAPMQSACDYKRAYDNDRGLNTGGMGAYSPAGFIDDKLIDTVVKTVIKPAVHGLSNEGCPYKGVLYAGIMLTSEGPKVLEFNARFGDPETQVILPRLSTDIMDIFRAIYRGTLSDVIMQWHSEPCVGVVLASGGYPGNYKKGFAIRGLDTVDPDIMVFHAGTRRSDARCEVLTDGGRVLTVVACAETMADARSKVYSNIKRITFDGAFYRSDIAAREVR